MTQTKICDLCGKVFEKGINVSRKLWAKARFCSRTCSANHPDSLKKRQDARNEALRTGKLKVWNDGKTGIYSKKQLKNLSETMSRVAKENGFGLWMFGRKGDLNGGWKGENVGYGALHEWVKRERGSPMKCEWCGKTSNVPQMIHWANVSGEYHRDLNDWIRLCAKCHKKHDKGRKQTKFLR